MCTDLNTYRLESKNPFNPDKVKKVLDRVLQETLEGKYDHERCRELAKTACGNILSEVKEFDFDRYKIICIVTIGEKIGQSTYMACGFLWDVEKDRFATSSLETNYLYGVAQCFGLYYE